MTKLTYFLNLILVLFFTVLVTVLTGNSLFIYIDIASLILAIILPLIVISFIYSPSEQFLLCGAVLEKGKNSDKALLTKSLNYFRTMKKLMIYAGVLYSLVGAIGISVHLEGPEVMGANFGVLMIVPLYIALYFFMILEPLRASAEKKLSLYTGD